jgi:hypothetical protein
VTAISELLGLIGLATVKREFINLYERVQIAKEQKKPPAATLNARFEGCGFSFTRKEQVVVLGHLSLLPTGPANTTLALCLKQLRWWKLRVRCRGRALTDSRTPLRHKSW